ncbi:hypothetical protein BRCON_2722 [Candidatus Sumerlaea chitinivorans]|uniref:Uncharacterized protein n=1 Tax=Sumerlaea chitinivorans TaxID=2250252 RepID=A0A2Z4Y884_SUMC1|nr:hypothetical protein BRCON_2722 [Candidatus Sumerlaea chitinivorans]
MNTLLTIPIDFALGESPPQERGTLDLNYALVVSYFWCAVNCWLHQLLDEYSMKAHFEQL